MPVLRQAVQWLFFATICLVVMPSFSARGADPAKAGTTNAGTTNTEIVLIQGTVEVARAGQTVWDLASTQSPYCRLHPGDQIRTKDRSRAAVRLSDLTLVELGPNSHLQVLRPQDGHPGFSLSRGLLHLFHRDKPGEFYFRTPTASPVIRGTEFNLEVAEDGASTLRLLEGMVTLTNEWGGLDLNSGQAALAQTGRPPARVPALETVNVIQWCLYYPAVLDLNELRLSADEKQALTNSLAAYSSGDLVAALDAYPPARQPGSDEEKVYLAALVLAVGEVSQAEELMNSLSGAEQRAMQLAGALRTLVASVKFQLLAGVGQAGRPPYSAPLVSSLLAESYFHQSQFELDQALTSVRAAVKLAPDFAFAWARLAELELSFGRRGPAREAVERALTLAPRNAEAAAVKGFLLASQNRTAAALDQFDQALAINAALGNAWLGRGLCKIRLGADSAAEPRGLEELLRVWRPAPRSALEDLLVAAALEPNRALLRSYLGKAFADAGYEKRARSELDLAMDLDSNDPTSWLYSALLNQQENRLNDAVRDLERSEELNDNRQLYRSRLLLDQDRAVRQANLAAIYQDAGLFDQSVREAARAVGSDYANYSAHLFLANSYAQQRDPNTAELRYETASFSEYLLAQLLSPVGGSALSPYVSQQEYSRLFDRTGLGVSSGTQYSSRGDWQEHGVLYGTFDNWDAAFDANYASQNGQQPNNDFKLRSLSLPVRVQVSPQDTFFVEPVSTEIKSGDLAQHYDPANAQPALRIKESQEPNLFAGYHHQWSPGSHTLALFSWLNDDFQLTNASVAIPTFRRDYAGIYGSVPTPFSVFDDRQRSRFTAYSGEAQQIWQLADNTLIFGGRYQDGQTRSDIALAKVPPSFANINYPSGVQQTDTHLQRAVVYAYDDLQVLDPLWLIGGLAYDWISYPENIDLPPITDRQKQKDQFSPKAGLIWTPTKDVLLRGAYTRSLGGLYLDNSVRLEPSQVAGFNQAFRSIIPESLAGLIAGAKFESAELDGSWRLPTETYLGLGLERLWSEADRNVGAYESLALPPFTVNAISTPQHVDFDEKSLVANLNQLIGRDWSLGARYRLSRAELHQHLTDIHVSAEPYEPSADSALLHQLTLSAMFAHPSGFFAEVESLWYFQDNQNFPDSDFWQFNVFGGYRFARRRVELLAGGLNLTGRDYRLNPINLHPELPRRRTLVLSLKFNF
ncbi:MAG: hypothetical protein C5B50_28915 [Verrucomicrobia bacterium]|nr:MAG: hypothetical protein C5B50_28915 [Verrucomicrobiota bacterium]